MLTISKVLVMTIWMGFFNGAGIQAERISYPTEEKQFEVVNAYYIDGDRITELEVVTSIEAD